MDDKRTYLLSQEKTTTAILKMSLPVVAGMIIQILYNLVDTFFVGMLGDSNQLAATNLAMPLFMVLMSIAGLIGTGASSYISRSLGEKNQPKAEKILSVAFGLIILIAIISTTLGLIFLDNLVILMGANSETFDLTKGYSLPLIVGAIFILGNFALGQIIRSEGSPMISMFGMLIGTIANIILDPVFIFGFKMGVSGAAVATVIGNALGFIYYVICYIMKDSKSNMLKTVLVLRLKDYKPTSDILKNIFAIGTPSTISQILSGSAIAVCNNLSTTYGNLQVASFGVANKIIMIGTFIFIGFGAGIQPLVGYNYGAKNFKRIKQVIRKSMAITACIGLFFSIVFFFFGDSIVSVFSPLQDVIDTASKILKALLWSLPFWGSIMISSISVQAMGKSLAALLLSILRQGLLYIPIAIFFNATWGFDGLTHAQPVSDFLTLCISVTVLTLTLKSAERKVI